MRRVGDHCGIAFAPALAAGMLLAACEDRESGNAPQGRDETPKTQTLEAGAALLQGSEPLDAMNVYLVGFHPLKENPSHQLEAHHLCSQVNEDFAQCALFDGNTKTANLTGIEYIISGKLFETLPPAERQYWHPHNYEILSGQLIAPNLPDIAELELMRGKMNSYGKTWHTWNTGADAQSTLPVGEPALAWSFNRDGEARPGLVESRDQAMDIDSQATRRTRQELLPLAEPQEGVDALKDAFEGETQAIDGVRDKKSAGANASD